MWCVCWMIFHENSALFRAEFWENLCNHLIEGNKSFKLLLRHSESKFQSETWMEQFSIVLTEICSTIAAGCWFIVKFRRWVWDMNTCYDPQLLFMRKWIRLLCQENVLRERVSRRRFRLQFITSFPSRIYGTIWKPRIFCGVIRISPS